MAKKKEQQSLRLGAGELELMQVLWREDGVTISEAQAGLERQQGYTTVQTRLERLVAKGVARKSKTRPAKYHASITEDDVSRDDLNVLVQRVTRGRVVPLIAHLVNDRPLTENELDQIRQLLEQAELCEGDDHDA